MKEPRCVEAKCRRRRRRRLANLSSRLPGRKLGKGRYGVGTMVPNMVNLDNK